eukprot:CAMPEP_0206538330 /NCGR_PEP_ID=MMETSP0325_2-20121206/7802_1 /ASSEMBLY_ACC=CAM_ASM_000347 /TAXON_ID=2866 /ORGANISM="Crypthecodinium cohnii, Strain Seligo" /LENGTH=70 /DNA_ID=CAMNT_0054035755 /DNA_START=379 /DNA_END=591 /DNA_ORIENTATION=-
MTEKECSSGGSSNSCDSVGLPRARNTAGNRENNAAANGKREAGTSAPICVCLFVTQWSPPSMTVVTMCNR